MWRPPIAPVREVPGRPRPVPFGHSLVSTSLTIMVLVLSWAPQDALAHWSFAHLSDYQPYHGNPSTEPLLCSGLQDGFFPLEPPANSLFFFLSASILSTTSRRSAASDVREFYLSMIGNVLTPYERVGEFCRSSKIAMASTHLVLCPRYIRQGQPYRFLVSLFQLARPVVVTAAVHRDGVEIAKTEREVATEGVPELIVLTRSHSSTSSLVFGFGSDHASTNADTEQALAPSLPTNLLPGRYRLQVEGAVNDFNGGMAFSNETSLTLLQRSLTVIVQIDRPLYRQGQTVRFRVIPVTTEFMAYQEALDIIMLNPSGFEMKRWLSRRTVSGWLGLEYPLSELPQLGRWTIRVKANGYFHDEHFYVKEYHPPPFEVRVHGPSFIIASAQFLRGTVYANYSNGASVAGNISVVAVMEAIREEEQRESRGYEMSLD
ncbi:CD109 antigen-like, partial [Tropilaelaps mercedesae]